MLVVLKKVFVDGSVNIYRSIFYERIEDLDYKNCKIGKTVLQFFIDIEDYKE